MNQFTKTPLTSEQMRQLENKGETIGISKLMLMENAGARISDFVVEKLKSGFRKQKILAVAGTGNNGGDVFVAMRHLAYWNKFQLVLVLLGQDSEIHAEEARTNWLILDQIPKIKKKILPDIRKISLLEKELSNSDAIIIGIFGTGFHGKPREFQAAAIEKINKTKSKIKVSVDLPSGMNADTGSYEIAVDSDFTVTMHAVKKGMLAGVARSKTGEIVEANIGLPF